MGHIQSDIISFLSKNIKVFQWHSKTKFLGFMTKVNPSNGNNENKIKLGIFPQDIFKSDISFHWSQNTELFQWLKFGIFQFNCKSEHKQVKLNEIKQIICTSDSFFLIYKVLCYLTDFWNLFLDKVYLKNEL